MKIYFACDLPIDLKEEVYAPWLAHYKETKMMDDAEIIICGIRMVDARFYKKALHFVCPATNTDHIHNLKSHHNVISVQGATELLDGVYATAEHTMTLICLMARRVFTHPNNFQNRYKFTGTTLKGKTLGIIGYGRVGRQLETIAKQGFGMRVLPYDIKTKKSNKSTIIKQSDFISINVSVTPNSPRALDRTDFAVMKRGVCIVNTSRGKAIDERFLIENHKFFGGIALDVLDGEPSPPNYKALKDLPNVILTPHISGCTVDDMKRTANYCLEHCVCLSQCV